MLDVTLPDGIRSYVQEQVARRGYRDAADYIESLVEADRRQQLKSSLEAELVATTSGPFSDLTDDDFDDVRRVGTQFLNDRRGGR